MYHPSQADLLDPSNLLASRALGAYARCLASNRPHPLSPARTLPCFQLSRRPPSLDSLFPGSGSAGHVCWIADNAATARAVFFYLPLVAVLCFTIFTYAKLRRTLAILLVHGGARATPGAPAPPPAGGHPAGGGHVLAALSRRFGSYVLVFMVVWTFPILNRVHNAFDPDHPLYTLFIGSALFAPMQGLGALPSGVFVPRAPPESAIHRAKRDAPLAHAPGGASFLLRAREGGLLHQD